MTLPEGDLNEIESTFTFFRIQKAVIVQRENRMYTGMHYRFYKQDGVQWKAAGETIDGPATL